MLGSIETDIRYHPLLSVKWIRKTLWSGSQGKVHRGSPRGLGPMTSDLQSDESE